MRKHFIEPGTRNSPNLKYPNHLLRKVPEITAIFWVVKLLSTALGESASDFLVFRINPYLAVFLGGVALAVALVIQFSVKKYIAWVYWLAVVMVAVFGTMAADGLHIRLGVPYTVSSAFFAVTLLIIFIVWYSKEKTLSIHSINTRRREVFYWLTVMATFALGTAAGDLFAHSLGFGYLLSALIFCAMILVPAIGYWFFNVNEVLAFWTAYVLTRPVGASFADWLGKPKSLSGLGYGDGKVAIVLSILVIVCVIYMTRNKTEAEHENPTS